MQSRGGAFFLTALLSSTPSVACSVIVPEGYEGSQKQLRDVRTAIDGASVILDGQVIRPYVEGQHNALVLAYRILKGPKQNYFEVGAADSCTLTLDHVGQRSRMILDGGPNVYVLYRDQSEARVEDRMLKSDRRKVWPFTEGRAVAQTEVQK